MTGYPLILKMKSCWNLTLSSVFALAAFQLTAQSIPDSTRTPGKGYLFPVKPGQINQLAGTMGELRTNHFHGGLDIRTNNQIGVPILATQDGYVSRINVSTASYGHMLQLTHPDGRVSLYGHLNQFMGKLRENVRKEQYRRKSFELDLYPPAGAYPVHRGDTIGLSGNTGASNGPHLHFEIREGNYQLNPLKFGYTEILDDIPPGATRIALRTLDINSRINDRFGRFEFYVARKSSSEFVLPVPILAYGRIGIELLGDDRMNNSPGRCGINYIEVYTDSQKVFSQRIERIDMDETRSIVSLMNYKTLETRGQRYNKLYIDDGNRLAFYEAKDRGIITITDRDKLIRIQLTDEAGNTSNVRLTLKHNPITPNMVLPTARPTTLEADLTENTLMITSRRCADESLTLFRNKEVRTMAPTYHGANQAIYLIDLRQFQPDSLSTNCSGTLRFHFKDVVPSDKAYTYYSEYADVYFPEQSLYDTLFLNVNRRIEDDREVFSIGQRTVPLHRALQVTLRPTTQPKRNQAVYRQEGRGFSYLGGDWNKGKVVFYTAELGDFTFLTDSIAPVIARIRLDRQSARFKIRDNLSGIVYYEANINGQWLLMIYDYKSGILQSDKLDPKQPLLGDFELKVVDRAGNERIFKQKIQ